VGQSPPHGFRCIVVVDCKAHAGRVGRAAIRFSPPPITRIKRIQ
jgi:hypothetical protein